MAETHAGSGSSTPAAEAARDLRVLIGRLKRRAREVPHGQELTPSQLSVIGRLDQEGPASASALAAGELIRPQSMAAILAALEERALIERRPDPADGRRQLVSLTAAGTAAYRGGRQARQEWLAGAFQELYTEEELALISTALGLLERLTTT